MCLFGFPRNCVPLLTFWHAWGRPLLSGAPQRVSLISSTTTPHINSSENLILCIFWCSSILQHFCSVDSLSSYSPIVLWENCYFINLFVIVIVIFINLFLKAYFFFWSFLEIWVRMRQTYILSLSVLNWSLSGGCLFPFLQWMFLFLFFFLGGNYHGFRGRVAADTLWTERQPARLPFVVWMTFISLSIELLWASFFFFF